MKTSLPSTDTRQASLWSVAILSSEMDFRAKARFAKRIPAWAM